MSITDSVGALTGEISERSQETEAGRSVPEELIRKIGATGALHLYVPRSMGGAQADPLVANAVIRELSRADGSTGWTSMILNTTFFSCWLDPEVAGGMLATDRELGMAGLFGPIGRTEPADDGALRLSGRYPFNSGAPHATWFCQGAFVEVGDQPQWRFMFVPASDVEILDTWHVAGLRGTASHDVVVDGALVPLERTTNPIFEQARHPEPHFRWSFFALLASLMSGFPLGVARRALDEFEALAHRKGRGGMEPLATEQVVQLEVARCEGALGAAEAFVSDALERAWETAVRGDEIDLPQRQAIRLAASNAMRIGIDVVDTTFRLAGGGALYEHSPLQRCWRDIHAGSNHIFFSPNQLAHAGRSILGQPADEWLL